MQGIKKAASEFLSNKRIAVTRHRLPSVEREESLEERPVERGMLVCGAACVYC